MVLVSQPLMSAFIDEAFSNILARLVTPLRSKSVPVPVFLFPTESRFVQSLNAELRVAHATFPHWRTDLAVFLLSDVVVDQFRLGDTAQFVTRIL